MRRFIEGTDRQQSTLFPDCWRSENMLRAWTRVSILIAS